MTKVFVSGGTSGLGFAIAEKFVASGATVFVHGRDPTSIQPMLRARRCRFVREDLLKPSAPARIVALVKKEGIDCFINNAGIYSDAGTGLPDSVCRAVLMTNLVIPILILKEIYEYYKTQRAGTIVSINSLAGLNPSFNEAVYSASKHGLRGFIKSLQMDAHRHNVRILDYYPGAIQTRITQSRPGFSEFIMPGEVAELIVANVRAKTSFVPVMQELRRAPTSV